MHYSFPILERKVLLADLMEIGSNLDEQQLLKPTVEVVWPLYENLLYNMTGITREELQQPAFHAMDALEFPELHVESVGCMASIRAIMKLMFAVGVSDFSMKDIFKPESQRTITNLSAIINYSKYRHEIEDSIADIQSDRDQCLLKIQQLEDHLQELNNEEEIWEAERRAEQPAVQALESETKELERNIQALNKQQGTLQSEIRANKQEGNTVSESANEKFELMQIKQEESKLRAQVVQSPEKLQRWVADRKIALQNMEAAAEEAQQALHQWKDKHESYTKVQKKMQNLLSKLDELEKLFAIRKATAKEIKVLKAKVKATEEEDQSWSTKLAEFMLQGQHLQELIEKLEQQGPKKLQESAQEVEETKSRCDATMVAQLQSVAATIAKRDSHVQELKDRFQETYKNKDAFVARGQAVIGEVQRQVLDYYRTVLAEKDALWHASLPKLKGITRRRT